MTKQVGIIGCGPSGLMVAHAAARAGYEPVIMSAVPEKSPSAKAVFLHAHIPDVSDDEPDGEITIEKVGSSAVYAHKVYGDPAAPTSWNSFQGKVQAWHLEPVYEALWHVYQDAVHVVHAVPNLIPELLKAFPILVNTAPMKSLCNGYHQFPARDLWVVDQLPPHTAVMENSMLYNGVSMDRWSRCSDLFGVQSTEYTRCPAGIDDVRLGIKVEDTDCDCHPLMHRAGRWGEWKRGVLLHHAFEKAEKLFAGAVA